MEERKDIEKEERQNRNIDTRSDTKTRKEGQSLKTEGLEEEGEK